MSVAPSLNIIIIIIIIIIILNRGVVILGRSVIFLKHEGAV